MMNKRVQIILLLLSCLTFIVVGRPSGSDIALGHLLIQDSSKTSGSSRAANENQSHRNRSAEEASTSIQDSLLRDTTLIDSTLVDSLAVPVPTLRDTLREMNLFTFSTIESLDDSLRIRDSIARIIVYSEQELRKMRRDSISYIKDSIKARKDSIRLAAPRVLNTYAVADSMHFKRIISWKVPGRVNELEQIALDTTFRDWQTEYPFQKKDIDAVYLGVIGSAAQSANFFKRENQENFYAFTPYNTYSYDPSNVPFLNTKGPYTELAYWGTLFAFKDKEESSMKFLHSQNVTPELNFTFLYEQFGAKGLLTNEATDSRSTVINTNYLGERYVLNAGYIRHSINRNENGGMTDTKWLRDTIVDAKTIPVHLSDASNEYTKNTFFLKHSYAFPLDFNKNDTLSLELIDTTQTKVAESKPTNNQAGAASGNPGDNKATAFIDSNYVDINEVPSIFFGHNSEYTTYSKKYVDNIALGDTTARKFYNDQFYINPIYSNDSISQRVLDNNVYVRIQPWISDALVSRIDMGVGHEFVSTYSFNPTMFLSGHSNVNHNNLYTYAGAGGKFRKYISWSAYADYYFAGYKQNDFEFKGDIKLAFFPFKDKSEGVYLFGKLQSTLKRPDWFANHYYSNHYAWENNFSKEARTNIEAKLDIPKWKMSAHFGYSLINNHVYYDSLSIIRQTAENLSVMSLSVKKDFRLWYLNLDHELLFQLSSNQEIIPLPLLTARLKYYFEFEAVKDALQVQFGANAIFNTQYYAPAYNPAVGVFYAQREEMSGNFPYIDIFLNFQWQQVNLFLKVTNMGHKSFNLDYVSAHQYMRPNLGFKLGVHWPFFTQGKENKTVKR